MYSYIVLDIETTGFAPNLNEILEISAYKVINGVVREKFSRLVKPLGYIPRSIQEMTGITQEMVKDADTIELVLSDFYDFVEDLPFLGHNLQFDYNFIKFKGKNLGFDFTRNGLRTGICTLDLSRSYLNMNSNKLLDVVKSLNIPICEGRAHRAEYDVYLTKMLYEYFLINFPTMYKVCTPVLLDTDSEKYGKAVNTDVLPLE